MKVLLKQMVPKEIKGPQWMTSKDFKGPQKDVQMKLINLESKSKRELGEKIEIDHEDSDENIQKV